MQSLPTLDRHSTAGIDVRRLQSLLVAAGQPLPGSTNSDGSFDGEFGDETEKALLKLTGSKVAGTREWRRLLGV